MFSIKVILRTDRENKAGLCPLNIRFTKDRKSVYFKTGIKLRADQWNHEKQMVKSSDRGYMQANMLLDSMIADLKKIAYSFEKEDKGYTVQMVRQEYINPKSELCVKEFAREWVKDRYQRSNITLSTLKKYNGILDKMHAMNPLGLPVAKFNIDYLKKFEQYLLDIGNRRNTIASNFSFLRAISHELIRCDYMELNDYPFRKWKITKEETERKFIGQEAIDKIKKLKLKPGTKIEQSRDIFLFCYQTGLRIGDALRLKGANFDESHIRIKRQKGKNLSVLPLTPLAKEILSRYYVKSESEDNYIFAFLSERAQEDPEYALNEQKSATSLINKNLRIISKRVGLERPISTHYARHSMATNALSNGVSMEEVQAVLGHQDIKTTQIYAKAHDQMVENAFAKIANL